ncbi:pectinesterase family protein [Mitsuaria sp. GD03876]|uniref:pectinesterase family protein n=1 Tax=Mitsuaria sp. GD03876 TaxID=2975399 RepID=UPI00244954F5|nr:pectinesterase family protein [Mitsuaria sp. GD03876]MDH0864585.1 pectinesterase family protein [Mitsuaria sp. GD03876]
MVTALVAGLAAGMSVMATPMPTPTPTTAIPTPGDAVAAGRVLASARPQLDEAAAATATVATYLGDWQPAPLDPSRWTPTFVVAADGSGTHRTVQAAIDALPAARAGAQAGALPRTYVLIKPGTYRGPLCAQGKAPFTLYGPGDPSAVVLVDGRYNALPKAPDAPAQPCLPALGSDIVGTAGSASVAILGDDVQLARLTIANDAMDGVRGGAGYPPGVSESGGAQAVALMTAGDRIQLEDVRLLGHQDTFYAEQRHGTRARVLVRRSEIRGDVDFIFGAATLVIDDSLIVSRAGRRAAGQGGHVLAPSTPALRSDGFLVINSRLLAEPGVAPGSISLGRAWDHGVKAGAWRRAHEAPNGQALIRDSLLGPHLAPWAASTSRRPFSASGEDANRLAEYRNLALPAAAFDAVAPGDGWASMNGGTVGGAKAAPAAIRLVRTRAELDAALALGDTPKLIALAARIDLAADASGRRLGVDDFRDPAFDLDAFVRQYDPATWGRDAPRGPLEDARRRSAKRQAARVVVPVPSHTTIVGIAPDAGFDGGSLMLERVSQVILRNLRFSDAYDFFPAWDPRDNGHGEWNSEYDTVSLREATQVWIDHCAFDDGERPDPREPVLLGQRMQRHDGLLDITRRSDFVTVSWNVFRRHDKTMLIGGGDGHRDDRGHLRVTLHHNLWEQLKERTPRVRYGQVHVANNLYVAAPDGDYPYGYSIGVGIESRLLLEGNAWEAAPGIAPERLARWLQGDRIEDRGSRINGAAVDLAGMLRAGNPGRTIAGEAGWTPPYRLAIEPADEAAARVRAGAGAGRLW